VRFKGDLNVQFEVKKEVFERKKIVPPESFSVTMKKKFTMTNNESTKPKTKRKN